jgi:hypothetical protein
MAKMATHAPDSKNMHSGLEKWSRWERTRSGGRTRFIWLWGVVAWGVPWGVLMTGFLAALATDRHQAVSWIIALPLPLGPIGGYFFGVVLWHRVESQYLSALQLAEDRAQQRQLLESLTREVRKLRETIDQEHTG